MEIKSLTPAKNIDKFQSRRAPLQLERGWGWGFMPAYGRCLTDHSLMWLVGHQPRAK